MKRPIFGLLLCLVLAVTVSAQPLFAPKAVVVEETTGKKFAVLIGVNDYARIDKLRYAKNDTEALRDRLIAIGFEPQNVVTLICGGETKNLPTKHNIETVIGGILNLAKEGDIVLISMSGHGIEAGGEARFCPLDTNPDDMLSSTVPIKTVFEALERSKATFKLMIVDACRDNPFMTRNLHGASVLQTIANPPKGVLLLQSCAKGEQSYEDHEIKRGIFTHYFVEGLGGQAADKDGKVTFFRLFAYASEATQRRALDKHRAIQRPYLLGEGADFVLHDIQIIRAYEAYETMERSRAQGLQTFVRSIKSGIPTDDIRRLLSPVPLDVLHKELAAEKSLALQYLIGEEESHLLLYGTDTEPRLLPLVLDKKQSELFDVKAGTLTAKKLQTILQNNERDGVLRLIHKKASTGRLDAKTLDKLAALWPILVPDEHVRAKITDGKTFERLLILPDGLPTDAFAQFPFEAMVVESDAENPCYLLDVGPATMYAPSASMYYNLKHRQIKSGKPHVLTVGNPDYEVHSRTRRGMFDLLPWTEKETEWIEESCKKNGITVTRLNLVESTEENVRKNIAGKRIVHFACQNESHNDLGYKLVLTIGDSNDPKNDGSLTLVEMFELDLRSCELAVLSTCDSFLMAQGILSAGARRAVAAAANWSIDDRSSAFLIHFFIDSVNESNEPDYAAALRRAKQAIRKSEDNPRWRHPYYWAAFVLTGPN